MMKVTDKFSFDEDYANTNAVDRLFMQALINKDDLCTFAESWLKEPINRGKERDHGI